MTMIPATNHHHQYLSKQCFRGGYGAGNYLDESVCFMRRLEQGYEYCCCTSSSDQGCLGSDHHHHLLLAHPPPMAENDSRADHESSVNETGSSSKDVHDPDRDHHEDWLQLQLSVGGDANHLHLHPRLPPHPPTSGYNMVELNLLPAARARTGSRPLDIGGSGGLHHHLPDFPPPPPRPISNLTNTTTFSTSLFLQQPPGAASNFPHHHHHHIQDINNWASRHIPQNITSASSSTSSSFLPQPSSYFAAPFQLHAAAAAAAAAGPSSDFRLVNANASYRPHSGLWFLLQASQNQAKEPFLPQIPKNYLRIKDGRMTVRLLMKYVANKLRLDRESEIEITCRGQQLLPFLTLQHVRDNIWSPRDTLTFLPPDSSTSDHVMVLNYGRSA